MRVMLMISVAILGLQFSYLAFGMENKKDEKFIREQIQSQMMEVEEGQLAVSRGTTESIRKYGDWIVAEHEKMLKDLKNLAIAKNTSIPGELPQKKADALLDLMQTEGTKFDRLFIKMMIIDLKRDVCNLKKVTTCKDPDIKAFGDQYLPVMQQHLEGAKGIQQSMNQASMPGSGK